MNRPRNLADVVDDLYRLTVEMTLHLEDADYLIEHIDLREELADEYRRLCAGGEPLYSSVQEKEQTSDFLAQVAEMDKVIINAIERLRSDIKRRLSESKSNQRVLNYTNAAISGSGSYMDYKK